MAFSINTNISSLQAQEYLRISGDFQNKTINRVTSGLRIVNSGDDAAGLAVANSFRSDRSVLAQGIRNANDGLATLQTIDGGINNISQLLDRARTLAAQAASGTFTGSRTTLNGEFQSVVAEIDRQAQSIGLDSGGSFARSISVFLGGGRSNGGITQTTNGSVSVDLSTSLVNSQALGLKGVQAIGVSGTDIGTGSASTSVSTILANTTNTGSEVASGFTDFYFQGPGFADSNKIKISVSTAGVTDTSTLVTAINTAIDTAGNGSTAAATAFKNAVIRASVNTDSDGKQQLAFSSSNAAFQVQAGDRLANALLGNFSSGSTGVDLANTVTGGVATSASGTTFAATANVIVRVQGSSLSSPVDLTLGVTTATTAAAAIASLSSAVASNSALAAAGISLTTATAGSALVFTSKRGERFTVDAAGDGANVLGLGSHRLQTLTGTSFDYTSISGTGGTFAAAAQTLEFSVGGGTTVSLSVTPTAANVAGAQAALNIAFNGNATLQAAGLVASTSGGELVITSSNGTAFRLNAVGATDIFGFNRSNTGIAASANAQSAITTKSSFNSGGASHTSLTGSSATADVFTFGAIRNGHDDQTVTISATDANGAEQSLAVVLRNDATTRNARSIDEAIDTINTQLRQSNNATLQKIVAVKEINVGGTAEGIRFLSTNSAFKVSIGGVATSGTVGLSDNSSSTNTQGAVYSSSTSSGGSTADIATQSNAIAAVTVLATAVSTLGAAQANVGKGQNQFNFAINLAGTQLTNLAAAESRIRDADLAQESANLTKAQILLQAGLAALAQANSAPQAVLALLRG